MGLITAYRKRDGAKVRIPEHWLGRPRLGGPFSRTKPVKGSKAVSSETVSDSKKEK